MKRSDLFKSRASHHYWMSAISFSSAVACVCWLPATFLSSGIVAAVVGGLSLAGFVLTGNLLAGGRYWSRRARWQAQDEQRAAIRPRI